MPLRDRSAEVVACINAFLFPSEYDRVLAAGGAVIFVSTAGSHTPIYLRPGDVLAAMPGRWDGVTSDAAWGVWTVVRRPDR